MKNELQPGCIIKRKTHGLFWHMGIYLGNNKVAHSKKGEEVIRFKIDTLQGFSEGQPIYVHLAPKDKKHAKEIIKKALELTKKDINYNLAFYNCEDMVRSIYGDKYNKIPQKTKVAMIAAIAGITLITAHQMKKRRKDNDKV